MGLPDETAARSGPEHTLPGFAELYAAQFRFVWSLAARLGVPSAVREDVAQEVWLTVHRRLHTLRPGASTRGWIAAITRKIAARHHRTTHRAERKHLALAMVDAPHSQIGERDSLALVDDALGRMDVGQREVFLLAHVEELRGPEIADALDVPLNTVYSRLRLARARLCEFLAQVEREEQAVIAAIRRRDEPPRGTANRVWMAVLGELGPSGGVLPVMGTSIGAKLAWFATGTLMVALLGAGLVDDDPPARAKASAPVVEAKVSAPAVVPTPEAAPIETPAPVVEAAIVATPVRGARPAAAREVVETTALAADEGIAAEARLLGDATRALSDGDARRALALLDEHARRFPRGAMIVEARAARVRSLCAIGQTEEAQRAALALVQEFPGSPSAAGVRDACSAPG